MFHVRHLGTIGAKNLYKASYVLRACDEYDPTENWYFRRQGTRCLIPLDSVAQLNYRKFRVLNYMQQFGKLEANVLTKLDRNAPTVGTEEATSKRDKFVDLAESRTKNAIKAIRVISKLGNKNAYEFTEADVKKIVTALNREVEALKARMLSTGGKEAVEFKL